MVDSLSYRLRSEKYGPLSALKNGELETPVAFRMNRKEWPAQEPSYNIQAWPTQAVNGKERSNRYQWGYILMR